jgi:GNAT superfamily N-acetyltransferase
MIFESIKLSDLGSIQTLQPDDWPDIVPDIELYLRLPFCYPLKVSVDNRIVGIGTSIVFENTGWLAHIIVHPEFRKMGLGSKIVNELLKHQQSCQVTSSMLVATKLGYPVYLKAGFQPVGEYIFFKRSISQSDHKCATNIIPYNENYRHAILQLDQYISGENRKMLLDEFLSNSYVYINNNTVEGYFIPGIKEGLIFAVNETAGIELMKLKYSGIDKAVIPLENKAGIAFLKENGFTETQTTGTRMIRGKNICWHPEMVYSRIGGNFG